jgi:hypothetical protein
MKTLLLIAVIIESVLIVIGLVKLYRVTKELKTLTKRNNITKDSARWYKTALTKWD